MSEASMDHVFLSHNSADKEFVRRIATALTFGGANVWFDEWQINPGDSIPGAISEALKGFSVFVLVWSKDAAQSSWVESEVDSATYRWISEKKLSDIRIVPVVIDITPLPPLLSHILHVDGKNEDHLRVAKEILGMKSEREFRSAVQSFISNSGIEFRYFHGAGVLVECPSCGADPETLVQFHRIDERRDDEYVGVQCENCGWSDSSEI